jgi:hypothetical protein
MTRMSRRVIARILAATLLFAQALVAFADCQMPTRSPAAAIAAKPAPCHESSSEKNLCVAHCLAADQSVDKPQAGAPERAPAPVLVLLLASDVPHSDAAAFGHLVPPAAAPPPRILFRPLRI